MSVANNACWAIGELAIKVRSFPLSLADHIKEHCYVSSLVSLNLACWYTAFVLSLTLLVTEELYYCKLIKVVWIHLGDSGTWLLYPWILSVMFHWKK